MVIPLFLTGNTDTLYVVGFLDLERDGPTVVEIPSGSGPGTVNDAFFRFVVDMGLPVRTGGRAAGTSSCRTASPARSRTATSSPARRRV